MQSIGPTVTMTPLKISGRQGSWNMSVALFVFSGLCSLAALIPLGILACYETNKKTTRMMQWVLCVCSGLFVFGLINIYLSESVSGTASSVESKMVRNLTLKDDF